MPFDSLLRGFSRRRGDAILLLGVSGVLRGIERLLTARPAPIENRMLVADSTAAKVVQRTDYFRIHRSGSEVGLTYWVLQGFGCFESFTLFDSWREAIDEANARIANKWIANRQTPSSVVPVSVYAS